MTQYNRETGARSTPPLSSSSNASCSTDGDKFNTDDGITPIPGCLDKCNEMIDAIELAFQSHNILNKGSAPVTNGIKKKLVKCMNFIELEIEQTDLCWEIVTNDLEGFMESWNERTGQEILVNELMVVLVKEAQDEFRKSISLLYSSHTSPQHLADRLQCLKDHFDMQELTHPHLHLQYRKMVSAAAKMIKTHDNLESFILENMGERVFPFSDSVVKDYRETLLESDYDEHKETLLPRLEKATRIGVGLQKLLVREPFFDDEVMKTKCSIYKDLLRSVIESDMKLKLTGDLENWHDIAGYKDSMIVKELGIIITLLVPIDLTMRMRGNMLGKAYFESIFGPFLGFTRKIDIQHRRLINNRELRNFVNKNTTKIVETVEEDPVVEAHPPFPKFGQENSETLLRKGEVVGCGNESTESSDYETLEDPEKLGKGETLTAHYLRIHENKKRKRRKGQNTAGNAS